MRVRDYILNGQAHGSVAGMLMASDFQPGALRPFIGKRGRTFISLQDGWKKKRGKHGTKRLPRMVTTQLAQATGTLLYEEWKEIDRAVVRAATPELRFFNDIRRANEVVIPNGLGTTVLQSAMIGDINPAEINMDGLNRADQDRPLMDLTGVPLPIIHKDFQLSLRDVRISRKSGYPLDTALPADATVKVAEEVEKLAVGVGIAYQFAGYPLYGAINFPGRLTVELSDPSAPGWTGADLVNDFISIMSASRAVGFRGPWRFYTGTGWEGLTQKDYSTTKGTNTLEQRLLDMRGVQSIDTLDFMPEWDIIAVQMDARVARAVIGLPLQTLQWEQQGGMELNFKVMTIMVPQFRADYYGGTGLVHASVPGGVDFGS